MKQHIPSQILSSNKVQNYGSLAKLIGGILLRTIVTNITWLTEPNSAATLNHSKMIIYSGHDTDVAPLATLLGIYDFVQPPYTACILLELHYMPSRADKWAVQIFYKNYTDSTGSTHIAPAIIPGCPSALCPLTRFVALMKSKYISRKEYRDICFPKESILFLVQILFAVVAVTFVVVIVAMFVVRSFRKATPQRYSRLSTEPTNIN